MDVSEPVTTLWEEPGSRGPRRERIVFESKQVVVVGGSVAGLFSALLLSRQGHRVTLVEREVLEECDSPVEAFEKWDRRGAPQTRHSHAFLARLHNEIKNREPKLYAGLLAAGAETIPFTEMTREFFPDEDLLPEDDEITLLACRRITFDWVLRRHVRSETETKVMTGFQVLGLTAETDTETGLPRVNGVQIARDQADPETLPADLVVDATGRNTRLAHWLEGIGAEPLEQDSESCGIFYCSRFYRLRPGVEAPKMEGPIGADLGYMKYAIFMGDSDIFSITLAASPDDEALRQLRKPAVFEAAARNLPTTSRWVEPSVSEPITAVSTYANLKNTYRYFVRDGQPLALGIFPVGDALMHQNPLAGRGCTMAWLSVQLLSEAFTAHPDNALAFAQALDAEIIRQVHPWYLTMRDQDRSAGELLREEQAGANPYGFQREDGSIDPQAYMRSLLKDGLMPALREDITVLRAFLRVFNLLDAPGDLMARPDLMQKVLGVWQNREQREPISFGPQRSDMVSTLEAAQA